MLKTDYEFLFMYTTAQSRKLFGTTSVLIGSTKNKPCGKSHYYFWFILGESEQVAH